MSILQDILESSTDPSVPTSDLLRKVQIAATRLGATTVASWARAELSGYEDDAKLPSYRTMHTNVMGLFTGPMQARIVQQLTAMPKGLEQLWKVDLRMPVVEIQALAESAADSDPRREWSPYNVGAYARSRVYGIEMFDLFSAWNVISRQSLLGIIDVIRTRAMEFALELQAHFPDAGEVNGPTVQGTPALATAVYNVTNNIYGHGANIAAGSNIVQTSRVEKGDLDGLKAQLAVLGLSGGHLQEFVDLLQTEKKMDGPRGKKFLEKVRSGAIRLSEGLSTDLSAELLINLGRSFLGLGL